MWDVQIAELAARQFNRISRTQLLDLGVSKQAISHRVAARRLVIVEQGVFAVAPVTPGDDWGHWMGATLTAPDTKLSHWSSAAAWDFWGLERELETVTRPGNGGPRRHGGIRVYRSSTLDGDCTFLRGIPITTPARTLLDLSAKTSERAIARMVREAVRLKTTTIEELGDTLGRHRGRRGSRRLGLILARYSGLPLERARSGAEVRAMEILRNAGRQLPNLNLEIAGEEADLSWPERHLIIEIDGGPFHLDAGEDARKQRRWEAAGWRVARIDAADVYETPHRLLRIAPNVPRGPL